MVNKQEPVEGDAPPWLRWLVYIMGAMLVLAFIGLFVGIFIKMKKPDPAPVSGTSAALDFTGADIRQMAIDGNHLAIANAREIVVIDIVTGQVVLRIPLK